MHKRRRVLVMFAVLVAVTTMIGSAGFTTTTADRDVTVDVVGDDEAYLALEYSELKEDVDNGTTDELLIVENYFAQSVDVTVEAHPPEAVQITLDDSQFPLGVGDKQVVSASFTCDADTTSEHFVPISFNVSADGTGVFVETTEPRQVEYVVACGHESEETGHTGDENNDKKGNGAHGRNKGDTQGDNGDDAGEDNNGDDEGKDEREGPENDQNEDEGDGHSHNGNDDHDNGHEDKDDEDKDDEDEEDEGEENDDDHNDEDEDEDDE